MPSKALLGVDAGTVGVDAGLVALGEGALADVERKCLLVFRLLITFPARTPILAWVGWPTARYHRTWCGTVGGE